MDKNVWLWLDDERDPLQHAPEPRDKWLWVKTAAEAISVLAQGQVFCASLDHDLSLGQVAAVVAGGPPAREATGYDVACWIEAHAADIPGGVDCHSMNPVGKARILAALAAWRKAKEVRGG